MLTASIYMHLNAMSSISGSYFVFHLLALLIAHAIRPSLSHQQFGLPSKLLERAKANADESLGLSLSLPTFLPMTRQTPHIASYQHVTTCLSFLYFLRLLFPLVALSGRVREMEIDTGIINGLPSSSTSPFFPPPDMRSTQDKTTQADVSTIACSPT